MATLINGNGNPRIYAAQDADLIAALAGDITGIAQIGNKFAATAVDANTISVADGVIVTKEGRRIQLDAGSTDMFVIPTGTTGVTNYYIIGYKLTTQSDDSQIAETFVQLMSSSSETITEDTFRDGSTDVYVSLYRVEQDGVNLGTITGLLPELTNISELKSDLVDVRTELSSIGNYQSLADGSETTGTVKTVDLTPYKQIAICIISGDTTNLYAMTQIDINIFKLLTSLQCDLTVNNTTIYAYVHYNSNTSITTFITDGTYRYVVYGVR